MFAYMMINVPINLTTLAKNLIYFSCGKKVCKVHVYLIEIQVGVNLQVMSRRTHIIDT